MKLFPGCRECSRLWVEFCETMNPVLRLRRELEGSLLGQDRKQADLIAPRLRAAEQNNVDAGVALERHEVKAHRVPAAVR